MRVMVVWPGATWATADVARGWANGLEACGVDVVRFRLDERILWLGAHLTDEEYATPDANLMVRRRASESLAGALYEYRPDLVVVVDGKDIPPEVWSGMRKRGERLVLIHTESPYEDARIASMHWCADLHLANDPAGVEVLERAGAAAYYQPHGYDPSIHYPGDGPGEDHGVVFVGSGFAGRSAFLSEVDWTKAGPLTLAGQWRHLTLTVPHVLEPCVADLDEPLPNEDAADLYRSARLGLNLYRSDYADAGHAPGWAVCPREVEMAACGLPFLRQPRPEGDALFPMLPTFTTPEELGDLAAWWLAHPDARHEAGAKAVEAVAGRTFAVHAAQLLSRVA